MKAKAIDIIILLRYVRVIKSACFCLDLEKGSFELEKGSVRVRLSFAIFFMLLQMSFESYF